MLSSALPCIKEKRKNFTVPLLIKPLLSSRHYVYSYRLYDKGLRKHIVEEELCSQAAIDHKAGHFGMKDLPLRQLQISFQVLLVH